MYIACTEGYVFVPTLLVRNTLGSTGSKNLDRKRNYSSVRDMLATSLMSWLAIKHGPNGCDNDHMQRFEHGNNNSSPR